MEKIWVRNYSYDLFARKILISNVLGPEHARFLRRPGEKEWLVGSSTTVKSRFYPVSSAWRNDVSTLLLYGMAKVILLALVSCPFNPH
jgi:hypothetical protein